MTVLGIDANSRKVAFFLLGDTPATHVVQVSSKVRNHAVLFASIFTECHAFFTTLGENVEVFIEKPLMGRNAHGTIFQAQTNGVVQAAALLAGMERVYEASVPSWKAHIGNGRADKAYVKSWLRTNYPVLADHAGDDQDLTDAAAIALYGQGCIARGDLISSGVLD